MSAGPGGWFEQLEAQLERQLETFLAANPAQEALLQEQEHQEKHQRLKRRRLELQGQADQARTGLLALVAEINQWQQRVQRARDAGAGDLAARAEQHLGQLMGQGQAHQTATQNGDRWCHGWPGSVGCNSSTVLPQGCRVGSAVSSRRGSRRL